MSAHSIHTAICRHNTWSGLNKFYSDYTAVLLLVESNILTYDTHSMYCHLRMKYEYYWILLFDYSKLDKLKLENVILKKLFENTFI